ncbi:hypothetical protein H4S04_005231, partial [Coemansia sp. S16]
YGLSSPEERYGVKNITNVLMKQAKIQGYIIRNYYNTQAHTDFVEEVSRLYHEGTIKYRLTEAEGLENGAQAILDLFEGKNFGKSIIKA